MTNDGELTLRSSDGKSSLTIKRTMRRIDRYDEPCPVFSVVGSIVKKTFRCKSLQPDEVQTFLASLRTFEQTRKGISRLEFKPELCITVEPEGNTGAAWLGVVVHQVVGLNYGRRGTVRAGQLHWELGFELPGEMIGHIVSGFEALLQ